MALIFADGADLYATGGYPTTIARKWTTANSGSVGITTGRIDGYALLMDSSNSFVTKTIADQTTMGIAFAFKIVLANIATNTVIIQLTDGGTIQIGVSITASQQLMVFRSTTATPLFTTAMGFSTDVWYQIEMKFTINNATGSVEMRLNGTTTPIGSVTGVDTQSTASAVVNDIRFVTSGGSPDYALDDVVFWNTSGPAPQNDWLGDVHINTILPNGAGATTQWGVFGAAANYQAVDEVPPNDNTDYVFESVVGEKDTYDYAATSGVITTVYATQSNHLILKTDAGAKTFAPVVRVSGTDYAGTTQAPGTSYAYMTEFLTLNPATATAWTQAVIDAAQFGQTVIS